MVAGFLFTSGYIAYFKLIAPESNSAEHWLFGISPEGIGALGMLLNMLVALIVCRLYAAPPQHIRELVDSIRTPGDR